MNKPEEYGASGTCVPVPAPALPARSLGLRVHYGYVVLGLIVITIFVALGLGRHGYTFILPAMQDSLNLTHSQTGELQSWNMLGYMVTVVFAGLLATAFGPRMVISYAILISALGLGLTGLIPTLDGARLGRFLAGVGGAAGNVPAMALVSAWFGTRRRGVASGAAVAGSSIGLMVTGPLVPIILQHYGPSGWRNAWLVLGVMALGVFVLCISFLRNRPAEMGLHPLGEASGPPADGNRSGSVSALTWGSVYRSGLLWYLSLIYFAYGFSYVIYSTFFAKYLVNEGNFLLKDAGLLWMNVGMVSVVSGFIWGSISDRWGRRAALIAVYLIQGFAFVLFGLSQGSAAIYISAGCFALTAWSIPALMAALCGDIFGARLAPAALGLITIVFGFGQVLGPFFAGRIADSTHSFAPAFVVAGVIALVLGAGGSMLLKPSTLMRQHR